MATITLTFNGTIDGATNATASHVGSIPDAMTPAFFAYYRKTYGAYWDGTQLTKSSKGKFGAANAASTDAQVFEAFAQKLAASVAAQVTRDLQNQAAIAAKAQVAAATVTQTS